MKWVKGLLCLIFPFLCLHSRAYVVRLSFNQDTQMVKAINSIECGKWDFAKLQMYKYGELKKLTGWDGKRFNKSKSSVKSGLEWRELEVASQSDRVSSTDNELKKIKSAYDKDLASFKEKSIDAVYVNYKDEIEELKKIIKSNLLGTLSKSNGKMAKEVNALQKRFDLVCEEIDCLHAQGGKYQMSNSNRELGYEEVVKNLESIRQASNRLLSNAVLFFEL